MGWGEGGEREGTMSKWEGKVGRREKAGEGR